MQISFPLLWKIAQLRIIHLRVKRLIKAQFRVVSFMNDDEINAVFATIKDVYAWGSV